MPNSPSYGHFAPGRILITAAVADAIPESQLMNVLRRHLSCDWGDVSKGDKALNDQALHDGGRLLSAYRFNRRRLLIITEEDRSATTVMLAGEY